MKKIIIKIDKMGCGSTILKKILIITFDNQYLKVISHIITKRDFEINENTNFFNYKDTGKNLLFTFLSNKQKWTWIHHFTGTYGTIIIYEGKDTLNNIKEIENILISRTLHKRPLLLIFDKNEIHNKDYNFYETIRYNLSLQNIKFLVQFIDFSVNQFNSELLYGLEWLFNEINIVK